MKKLLYIHQYFQNPESNASSIRSYEVAYEFARSNYNVTVITTSHALGKQRFKKKVSVPGTENKITVITMPITYSNKFSFKRRIYAFAIYAIFTTISAIIIRTDIIYASSTPLSVALPALVAKLIKRTPYVLEVRDVWPDVPIALGIIKGRWKKKVVTIFAKLAYQQAKGLVALSIDMKRRLILNYKIKDKSCIVATNFFSLDEFAYDNELNINQPDIIRKIRNSGRKVLLYSGTLGIVNNPKYLVDLAYELKDLPIHILVIGSGNKEKEFIQYAKDCGVMGSMISKILPLERKNLIPFMYYSDFMISTVKDIDILSDNSANKFFESLASRSVVMINHDGWMESVLEESNSGLSLTQDVRQARAKILELMSNPGKIAKMKNNARVLAIEKYSSQIVTPMIIDFVTSVI